jgi:hypothetical protein
VSDNIAASANNRAWSFDFTLQALSATNSQIGSGIFKLSDNAAATTGTGPLTTPTSGGLDGAFATVAGTVDYTASSGIVVSVIHSTASASLSISTTYYRLEIAS